MGPSSTPPHPSDDRDLLPYVSGALSDALAELDKARSAVGTALVWTRIAIDRNGTDEPTDPTDPA